MGQFKIFIKKLSIFIILCIVFDFLAGTVFEHYYFSKKSETEGDNKLYYSLNNTKADILIFGASTAIHGYVPQIIEDTVGMTCYNTGWNGIGIYFLNTLLSTILQRYTPKVVVLDMNAWDLVKADDDFDKIPELYPYYYTNKYVKEVVDMSGEYEKYKMLSKTYRYNSKLVFILTQNIDPKTIDQLGYEPIYGRWNSDYETDTMSVAPYDSVKFSVFNHFVTHAADRGCKVVVVSPPVYRKYVKDQYARLKPYLKEKNAVFFDFRNDTAFLNHREYFYDYVHLNDTGARFFSGQIADSLKKIIGS